MARKKSFKPRRREERQDSGPRVMVVEVVGVDDNGDPLARPMDWRGDGAPPEIIVREQRRGRGRPAGPGALGVGDRALVRLQAKHDERHLAAVIRRIMPAARTLIGVFDGGNLIRSTERAGIADYAVGDADAVGAEAGELVLAEVVSQRRMERARVRILERLGTEPGTRAFSLIAIRNNEVPYAFERDAIEEAEAARPVTPERRVDLRDVPLVTIDGEDARDFDDAVWAEEAELPEGAPGWHMIVAIADVAWYVRPDSALDREALCRGNSVYFPDRVVPMLPEALSNGLCSLKPHEDRACMAAHIWIDADGRMVRHKFERAIMRSAHRLTYERVQHAHDTGLRELAPITAPLYGAFRALMTARKRREPLELDLPERYIALDVEGQVRAIAPRERLDSHRLIEEFMIAANVAAAETLEHVRKPCMYRIHDAPPHAKMEAFIEFLRDNGLKFAKGQVVRPVMFNQLLARSQSLGMEQIVNEVVLRSQAQAEYSTDNIGHFGLALGRYCHFTSPIRRYADLLVHRALISGLRLGEGGLQSRDQDWKALGPLLTGMERRGVSAEREAADRFVSSFYVSRIGEIVAGRIAGASRSGLFVRLDESLADGFVPRRFTPGGGPAGRGAGPRRKGRRPRPSFEVGDPVRCRIVEAEGIRGSLVLEILEDEIDDA